MQEKLENVFSIIDKKKKETATQIFGKKNQKKLYYMTLF